MDDISKMQYLTGLRGADLTSAEYRVLVTVWTYTDKHMRSAYPGYARLVRDCCMSRASVKRAVASLTMKGYLIIDARGGWDGSANKANTYRLALPAEGGGVVGDPTRGVMGEPGGVVTGEPLSDHLHQSLSSDPSFAPDLRSEPTSLRSPSLSERRREDERKHLLDLVRAVATTCTDDERYHAAETFLSVFEDAGHADVGFWDYGWDQRLTQLVRDEGLDYGSAKWLGIFTNACAVAA